ncbi:MAG: hypothetical protein LUG98_12150, partial [Tannerellaceae bacterium]|nr:hypothetical protein [Tannerellaceae bacterium]
MTVRTEDIPHSNLPDWAKVKLGFTLFLIHVLFILLISFIGALLQSVPFANPSILIPILHCCRCFLLIAGCVILYKATDGRGKKGACMYAVLSIWICIRYFLLSLYFIYLQPLESATSLNEFYETFPGNLLFTVLTYSE